MQLIKQLSGPGAAGVGVLGLAISGTVWNFYGVQFGLSGTVASLLALAVGLFLLRPLPLEPEAATETITLPEQTMPVEVVVADASSDAAEQAKVLTTAEAIAQELAAEAAQQPAVLLVNYAPEHLLAGKNLPSRKRQPGPSLQRYRTMTSELFRS